MMMLFSTVGLCRFFISSGLTLPFSQTPLSRRLVVTGSRLGVPRVDPVHINKRSNAHGRGFMGPPDSAHKHTRDTATRANRQVHAPLNCSCRRPCENELREIP